MLTLQSNQLGRFKSYQKILATDALLDDEPFFLPKCIERNNLQFESLAYSVVCKLVGIQTLNLDDSAIQNKLALALELRTKPSEWNFSTVEERRTFAQLLDYQVSAINNYETMKEEAFRIGRFVKTFTIDLAGLIPNQYGMACGVTGYVLGLTLDLAEYAWVNDKIEIEQSAIDKLFTPEITKDLLCLENISHESRVKIVNQLHDDNPIFIEAVHENISMETPVIPKDIEHTKPQLIKKSAETKIPMTENSEAASEHADTESSSSQAKTSDISVDIQSVIALACSCVDAFVKYKHLLDEVSRYQAQIDFEAENMQQAASQLDRKHVRIGPQNIRSSQERYLQKFSKDFQQLLSLQESFDQLDRSYHQLKKIYMIDKAVDRQFQSIKTQADALIKRFKNASVNNSGKPVALMSAVGGLAATVSPLVGGVIVSLAGLISCFSSNNNHRQEKRKQNIHQVQAAQSRLIDTGMESYAKGDRAQRQHAQEVSAILSNPLANPEKQTEAIDQSLNVLREQRRKLDILQPRNEQSRNEVELKTIKWLSLNIKENKINKEDRAKFFEYFEPDPSQKGKYKLKAGKTLLEFLTECQVRVKPDHKGHPRSEETKEIATLTADYLALCSDKNTLEENQNDAKKEFDRLQEEKAIHQQLLPLKQKIYEKLGSPDPDKQDQQSKFDDAMNQLLLNGFDLVREKYNKKCLEFDALTSYASSLTGQMLGLFTQITSMGSAPSWLGHDNLVRLKNFQEKFLSPANKLFRTLELSSQIGQEICILYDNLDLLWTKLNSEENIKAGNIFAMTLIKGVAHPAVMMMSLAMSMAQVYLPPPKSIEQRLLEHLSKQMQETANRINTQIVHSQYRLSLDLDYIKCSMQELKDQVNGVRHSMIADQRVQAHRVERALLSKAVDQAKAIRASITSEQNETDNIFQLMKDIATIDLPTLVQKIKQVSTVTSDRNQRYLLNSNDQRITYNGKHGPLSVAPIELLSVLVGRLKRSCLLTLDLKKSLSTEMLPLPILLTQLNHLAKLFTTIDKDYTPVALNASSLVDILSKSSDAYANLAALLTSQFSSLQQSGLLSLLTQVVDGQCSLLQDYRERFDKRLNQSHTYTNTHRFNVAMLHWQSNIKSFPILGHRKFNLSYLVHNQIGALSIRHEDRERYIYVGGHWKVLGVTATAFLWTVYSPFLIPIFITNPTLFSLTYILSTVSPMMYLDKITDRHNIFYSVSDLVLSTNNNDQRMKALLTMTKTKKIRGPLVKAIYYDEHTDCLRPIENNDELKKEAIQSSTLLLTGPETCRIFGRDYRVTDLHHIPAKLKMQGDDIVPVWTERDQYDAAIKSRLVNYIDILTNGHHQSVNLSMIKSDEFNIDGGIILTGKNDHDLPLIFPASFINVLIANSCFNTKYPLPNLKLSYCLNCEGEVYQLSIEAKMVHDPAAIQLGSFIIATFDRLTVEAYRFMKIDAIGSEFLIQMMYGTPPEMTFGLPNKKSHDLFADRSVIAVDDTPFPGLYRIFAKQASDEKQPTIFAFNSAEYDEEIAVKLNHYLEAPLASDEEIAVNPPQFITKTFIEFKPSSHISIYHLVNMERYQTAHAIVYHELALKNKDEIDALSEKFDLLVTILMLTTNMPQKAVIELLGKIGIENVSYQLSCFEHSPLHYFSNTQKQLSRLEEAMDKYRNGRTQDLANYITQFQKDYFARESRKPLLGLSFLESVVLACQLTDAIQQFNENPELLHTVYQRNSASGSPSLLIHSKLRTTISRQASTSSLHQNTGRNPHNFFAVKKSSGAQETHWYNHEEMQKLLEYFFGENEQIELFTPIDCEFQNGSTLTENLTDKMRLFIESEARPKYLLLPINIGNRHWVALVINIIDRDSPKIFYADPFGAPMPIEVRHAIDHVFPRISAANIIVSPARLQEDGYNCGPWAIEIFKSLVNTQALPNGINIANARREQQEILSNLVSERTHVPSALN